MPKYVYSKIKWDLSIYDLSETWVKENTDSNLNRLYRKWLQFPFSANIPHLHMSQNKLGLDITSATNLYNEYKLSVRRILKTSPNLEGRKLTKSQALNMLIQTQSQIKLLSWSPKNTRLKRTVVKSLTITITKIWDDFIQLKEQSNIVQSITIHSSSKEISRWQKLVKNLPTTHITFVENI